MPLTCHRLFRKITKIVFAAITVASPASHSEELFPFAIKSASVNAAPANAPLIKNVKTHINPSIDARSHLPATILNRNNFENFDLQKELQNPTPIIQIPGLEFSPAAIEQRKRQEQNLIPHAAAAFPAAAKWNPLDMKNYGGIYDSYTGLTNIKGVTTLTQHNLYLNCTNDSCWGTGTAGNITTVQTAMNSSSFMSITNQYVGSTTSSRYPLGTGAYSSPWAAPHSALWNSAQKVLLDSDVWNILYAAITGVSAFSTATGYGHIYHLFVPPGTDVCFDSSQTVCYSPDYNPSFAFCGYHSSIDMYINGAWRHVLYSVEPNTYINGCYVSGQTANDAQISVLSHELFEAITDPDPNYQWNSADSYYGEIGDICAWNIFNVTLSSSVKRNIQLEYSNLSHSCSASP